MLALQSADELLTEARHARWRAGLPWVPRVTRERLLLKAEACEERSREVLGLKIDAICGPVVLAPKPPRCVQCDSIDLRTYHRSGDRVRACYWCGVRA